MKNSWHDSRRVPGYTLRRIDAEKVEHALEESIHRYDVKGDAKAGIPSRIPTATDAERLGDDNFPAPRM
jgi:hypothetical protein